MGAVTATAVAVTAGSGVDAGAAAGVPFRVGVEAVMDAVAEVTARAVAGTAREVAGRVAVVRAAVGVGAVVRVGVVQEAEAMAEKVEVERVGAAKVPPGTEARAEARVPRAEGQVAAKAAVRAADFGVAAGQGAARRRHMSRRQRWQPSCS